MKTAVVCVALMSACAAFAVEVGALPQSEFADTEVSTNVALSVGAAKNRRLVFSVELLASPSSLPNPASPCG